MVLQTILFHTLPKSQSLMQTPSPAQYEKPFVLLTFILNLCRLRYFSIYHTSLLPTSYHQPVPNHRHTDTLSEYLFYYPLYFRPSGSSSYSGFIPLNGVCPITPFLRQFFALHLGTSLHSGLPLSLNQPLFPLPLVSSKSCLVVLTFSCHSLQDPMQLSEHSITFQHMFLPSNSEFLNQGCEFFP